MEIKISWPKAEIIAKLNSSETALQLGSVLPVTSPCSTWGNEIYFAVPVTTDLADNAQSIVDPGTLCFWVQGNSVAIPYGPTPLSKKDECQLVTEVNIIGHCLGDPYILNTIQSGDHIMIEQYKN